MKTLIMMILGRSVFVDRKLCMELIGSKGS